MYETITCCRSCKQSLLTSLFDLGEQYLASRFPKIGEEDPIKAPLELVMCENPECELIQLSVTVNSGELYTNRYGYRSGLNQSMITHLSNLVKEIEDFVELNEGDIVLDIGSNDCTLLKSYSLKNINKVGIDPTGLQFKEYYPTNVDLLPTFFNAQVFLDYSSKKAKVVTSISMFYDLPDPVAFARDVKNILADDGVWVMEQSYCQLMISQNSFDTICHEHLEYYTSKSIQYICKQASLKIFHVSENTCNGGSFRLYLTHEDSNYNVDDSVATMFKQECVNKETIRKFVNKCQEIKTTLMDFINKVKTENKTIYLYSASTKGNTLLQYCGIDYRIITAAAERNPEKYGCYTPGTHIPIVSEADMRVAKPDYLIALAWHFRESFLANEEEYMNNGGKMIFPLPILQCYP